MSDDEEFLINSHGEEPNYPDNNSIYFFLILFFLTILMFLNLKIIITTSDPFERTIQQNTSVGDGVLYTWLTTQKPSPPSSPYDFNSLHKCGPYHRNSSTKRKLFKLLKPYQECAMEIRRFDPVPNSLLLNWAQTQYVCDDMAFVSNLPLRPFEDDRNKTYWGLVPKCQDENTMLTLGVKSSTKAEQNLKMNIPNLKLYGTSSFSENSEVYDKTFKKTIGNEANNRLDVKFRGGNGKIIYRRRKATDFVKFWNSELKSIKVIDFLWINLENGEFPYWTAFSEDGIFDKLGVTVCQFNIEVANSEIDARRWKEFTFGLNQKGRFIWLRPSVTPDDLVVSSYFLNVRNEYCINKYIL